MFTKSKTSIPNTTHRIRRYLVDAARFDNRGGEVTMPAEDEEGGEAEAKAHTQVQQKAE